MRRRSTHLLTAGLAGALLTLAGCEGDAAQDAPTVAGATASPTPDDANRTTAAPTTAAAAEETSAEDTADAAPATTPAAATPTPTEEAAAATTEEEAAAAEPAPAGDVIVVQEGAVFTTPAQAAFCSLSAPTGGMAATVTCEVGESSVPPGEELMGLCPSDGYGWYFNFFEDAGHGGFWCNHHEGIVHLPGGDLAGDPWVDQSQVHVTDRGTRVPILGYGRVLRAGNLSCSVQPDGLTCASPVTGHGFTVNTASYVSW